MLRKNLKYLIVALILAAIIAGCWIGCRSEGKSKLHFLTEAAIRGDLQDTIAASGTLEPEELVNVGAQVSGRIMNFGTDVEGKPIDFGSEVKKGMILANIDEVLYSAALKEAQASKMQAEAAILSSAANVKQVRANLALAEHNWSRAQELYPKGAMAKSEYDSAQADYLSKSANIAVAEAEQEKAKAQLAIAEAAMVKAERNLSYCVIRSPEDGVVVDRRVSVGQTLVSNMSASSVFLIAKDLKKMQVWVAVNEADIGGIVKGMPVIFSVDAFPDQEFQGTVKKVRLNATMSQNVVTYVVEVVTDNADRKLLPYLTANVRFIKRESKNALQVPNAALRFQPAPDQIDSRFPVPEAAPEASTVTPGKRSRNRMVWTITDKGLLRGIPVTIGMIAGSQVEVLSGDLKEGDQVVTRAVELSEEEISAKKTASSGSPFMPKLPARNRMQLNKRNGGGPGSGPGPR